jgi:hypothetical protein
MWFGKRDSLTRRPLLPLNAGTAEPVRVSPPEAVAYPLELIQEGYPVDENILARLSPYLTAHVNRFGHYILNFQRQVPPPDYTLNLQRQAA